MAVIRTIVTDGLLVTAVLVELTCVLGLCVMRTPLQKLHFIGPATCVGPVFAGLAVLCGTHATASQAGKGLVVAIVLLTFAGVLSHETGRCIALRERNES